MKLHLIEEPKLEFATGHHICPRYGISNFNVYDTKMIARRDRIFIGSIGTSDNLGKLAAWIEKCSDYIPAKPNNRQPNLYTDFCGFNQDSGYKSRFVFEEEITKSINSSEIKKIVEIPNWNDRVNASVELYYQLVKFLSQNRTVDVIICIIPTKLYDKIAMEDSEPIEDSDRERKSTDNIETNFRRALKAKTMHLGKPLQLIKESSLDAQAKGQQDDATKAWNFCTALYYKANQTVCWKLITNVNKPSICFVGVSFYKSRDKKILHTSLAQIFDELGNGVILRGTPVDLNKDDRQPHLTDIQAYDLLKSALYEYRIAMNNSPGRLVIHKSSNYSEDEMKGFRQAVSESMVNTVDFVTILQTDIRLFRHGIYPPYRGTHIELEQNTHLLYTRGSVKYYRTYPGAYIPQPLEIRIIESDESPSIICQEILGLTKMSWNNTQFDGKYPITIQCARKVGEIMKYLGEHEQPQIRYSFYM
ncbi:hypothetical protein B9G53_07690 [Pseudanabaena sp. SR411]|uniref:argonaute/piwi family protein n=1 Tax=Pseudanabaena sp. SR411 TaxID=1980935 RepID=UPI000B98D21A|nr:hypothetical protein [Pseudanabaena sp. SR411]OYQ65280.1 hypothetical protein B9G53_07690 [Pseudanabaena sp. SR411]